MRVAVFFLVLLAGCASGGARTAPDRVVMETSAGMTRRTGNPVVEVEVALPPDTAFTLIKAAYERIGVEVKSVDPVTRRVGNSNFILRREFGGTPLSAYFDCGDGLTGPFADRARVFVSLMSTVHAKGGGAVITTVLEATAQDVATSSDRKHCGTTGKFESQLREAVEMMVEVRTSMQGSASTP